MWKINGHMRWTVGSGLGVWAQAQNAVRLGMAVDLLPGGQRAAEVSYDEITADGHYVFMLIFPDSNQALAVDTFNTLTAPSVVDSAWMHPITAQEYSKVTVHECHHDQEPPGACDNVTLSWADDPGGS